MERVKVYIKNDQKDFKIPTGIRLMIRKCCQDVLEEEKFEGKTEVSVTFVSSNAIKELNSQYRNKDSVTDVLSFPLGENGEYDLNPETGAKVLGDVVICVERAYEQADMYNHSFEREIGFLTTHSMLHLLGYDHENGGMQERIMRDKEETVLEELGISREKTFNI